MATSAPASPTERLLASTGPWWNTAELIGANYSPGAEVWMGPGSSQLMLDDGQRELLAEVRKELAEIAEQAPGTLLEDKPAGVVLHTRLASADVAEDAVAAARAVLQDRVVREGVGRIDRPDQELVVPGRRLAPPLADLAGLRASPSRPGALEVEQLTRQRVGRIGVRSGRDDGHTHATRVATGSDAAALSRPGR